MLGMYPPNGPVTTTETVELNTMDPTYEYMVANPTYVHVYRVHFLSTLTLVVGMTRKKQRNIVYILAGRERGFPLAGRERGFS